MVYISRIYTRSGDDGQTSLGDGSRVAKTHPRIAAYGTVDELNSVVGLVLLTKLPEQFSDWLSQVQNDLFDVGADLCVPEKQPSDQLELEPEPLRVSEHEATRLEGWIDQANASLEPLTSFVLPGGTLEAAQLHHARTVCRRAELAVQHLREVEAVNAAVFTYLNRLSDLLFVLARACNNGGKSDVLWKPGANR